MMKQLLLLRKIASIFKESGAYEQNKKTFSEHKILKHINKTSDWHNV